MTKPVVFISYSRRDEAEKNMLVSHLAVLKGAGLVGLWTDESIGVGENWRAEMSQAIQEAKVAVLLVTANFLNSELILHREIPELLRRHQNDGLVVIPVIARACAWRALGWLNELEVRPTNGVPVWSSGGIEVDEQLSLIAEEILEIVKPEADDQNEPQATENDGRLNDHSDNAEHGPDLEPNPAGPWRILIVDDEPSWQKRLSRILREINCTVVTASSYEQVEAMMPNFDFDLVTVDLNLDKSTQYADGRELALRIRETVGDRIPIIVITGTGSLEEQRRAFKEYNVFDFIQKGKLDLEEFQKLVSEALGNA